MHQLDQVLGKAFQVKEDLCGGSRRWGALPVGFFGWSACSRASSRSLAAVHVLSQPWYSHEMLDLKPQAGPGPWED